MSDFVASVGEAFRAEVLVVAFSLVIVLVSTSRTSEEIVVRCTNHWLLISTFFRGSLLVTTCATSPSAATTTTTTAHGVLLPVLHVNHILHMQEDIWKNVLWQLRPVSEALLDVVKHPVSITPAQVPGRVVKVIQGGIVAGDLHHIHQVSESGHHLTLGHWNQPR